MGKNRITITGEFQKEDGADFTKSERENIAMDLASFAEERGFVFIGMTK